MNIYETFIPLIQISLISKQKGGVILNVIIQGFTMLCEFWFIYTLMLVILGIYGFAFDVLTTIKL